MEDISWKTRRKGYWLFKNEKVMKEKIELGKTYPFQISLFEPNERKMTLVYLGEGGKPKEEVVSAEPTAENKEPKEEKKESLDVTQDKKE